MPIEIIVPKLGWSMEEGGFFGWLKKDGEFVRTGDPLYTIESDKAAQDVEATDSGLLKILPEGPKPGDIVKVGSVLGYLVAEGETLPAPAATMHVPPITAAAKAEPTPIAVEQAPAPPSTSQLPASPRARRAAADHGVDLLPLQATGKGGRIRERDVLAAARLTPRGSAAKVPAPTEPARDAALEIGTGSPERAIQDERVVSASRTREVMARRLCEAKTTIPHFYLEIEVDAGPLLELRQQLNGATAQDCAKLSVNDFILKACAEALRRVPAVNASWERLSSGTGQIRYYGSADVAFAVAIEDGLVTPVIRQAHLKSVTAISSEAKALLAKAKDKKLSPADYSHGTFCVSNLGMYGVRRFLAIVNPPNAAILAVGAITEDAVVRNGALAVGQRMAITMSCDHRVVDGALGAQFLAALKSLLESPAQLRVH